jgi:hypothetical protein
MFMMETILMNPTLNTIDIINKCIEIGNSDPLYFRYLIRGYKSIISKEIRFYFRKHIKHKMGSAEAKVAFSKIDARELIESTLAETKQRVHPHPRMENAHNSIIRSLDIRDIASYVNFIETGTLFNDFRMQSENRKWYAVKLALLMTTEKLTWNTLNHQMFLFYFRSIKFGDIPFQIEKCSYFLNWGEYPPDSLTMFYSNLKINNTKLMDAAQRQYPNFFDFHRALIAAQEKPHIQDSQETITEELDKVTEILDLYVLIQYKHPITDDEFMEADEDKSITSYEIDHDEVITQFLLDNRLNVIDLIRMNTLFKL